MIDIKPCPFCKFNNPYVEYHFYKDTIGGNGFGESWVTCPMCDARGPKEAFPNNMSVMEAAIQAWNER